MSDETMTRIALAARLDSTAAPQLESDLKSAARPDLEIDASEVTFLGGRCLQLLLAAQKTAVERGGAMSIVRPSQSFREMLVRLGAASFFKEDLEKSA
ncbi:MAG: STAS domain-containing protein [Pseudomonadota bacterium]